MQTKHGWRSRAQRLAGAVTVTGFLAVALALVPGMHDEVAAASAKVTICHRTHSTTNPYRRITVSQSAITRNHGHGDHVVTNGNPAVYDATFTYASNNKIWGDVIPGGDADGVPYNGANNIAENWTVAGKGLFFSSSCAGMSAKRFYDVEIAAGVPEADVIADLNSQSANEDAALLAALGGSFTAGNISQWETAVTLTTNAATSVTGTSAALNGALTVGTTSTAAGFDYGTSSTLATYTSVAATPTPVTGSNQAVTAALSSLTAGTTYYFRVTGTTNAGTDTEGILTGAILSFTTTAAPTTTTTAAPTTTTTVAPATTTSTTSTTAPTTTTTTTVPPTTTTTSTTTTTTSAPVTSTTTTTAVPSIAELPTATAPTTVPPTTSPSTTTPSTTTPSTTTPPTSTPPTTAVAGEDAAIRGIVWFDRNRNGLFDGREWVLPGVTVTLGSPVGARSFAAASAPTKAPTAVTAADGSYVFNGLVPGAYTVTAAAQIEGFDYTSDTDGDLDWRVNVNAKARQVGVADFAGLGRGEVLGQMFEKTTKRGLPFAAVRCRWAGYDDVLGNADDVPFEVTAAADGTFDMRGVPYGNFTCGGTDSAGRTSATVEAAVFNPAPVHAPLPVDMHEARPASLARTGIDVMRLVFSAILCIGTGLQLVRASRRRQA